jgi:hypothetical protein
MKILRALGFRDVGEPSTARDRLRAALTARDEARDALVAAQESVARVETVIESARAADRRTREAERTAADAAAKWAAAGAPSNDHEHERLGDAIAVAERSAEQAWFLANGARAGLAKVKEVERDCQTAFDRANDEIREAIGEVLRGEVAPQLIDLEIAARAYERVRIAVAGLYRLLDPARPGWRDDATHQADEAARLLRAELQACEVHPLGERTCVNGFHRPNTHTPQAVLEATSAWRDYAQRLRNDPDAQF